MGQSADVHVPVPVLVPVSVHVHVHATVHARAADSLHKHGVVVLRGLQVLPGVSGAGRELLVRERESGRKNPG